MKHKMDIDVDEVVRLIDKGYSIRNLARHFGITGTPMRKRLEGWGLKTNPASNRTWTENDLREAVKISSSKKRVIEKLGLSVRPRNYETVNKYISEYCIDISHFNPYDNSSKRIYKKIPLEDILVKGSTYNRTNLKKRILKNKLIENRCDVCGMSPEWNGELLVLVLDHINGDSTDNRLKNLRFMCPNCNSQQDTFCRRGEVAQQ